MHRGCMLPVCTFGLGGMYALRRWVNHAKQAMRTYNSQTRKRGGWRERKRWVGEERERRRRWRKILRVWTQLEPGNNEQVNSSHKSSCTIRNRTPGLDVKAPSRLLGAIQKQFRPVYIYRLVMTYLHCVVMASQYPVMALLRGYNRHKWWDLLSQRWARKIPSLCESFK